MEHHRASGGVIIRRFAGGEIKALLIKDSYGRWTWPKGHIEQGETPLEAAAREIKEETGLSRLSLLGELGKQEYWFRSEGRKVFKTVNIYLFVSEPGEELKVQLEEIRDARWFDTDEAVKKIEYEGSAEMLKKGIELFWASQRKTGNGR